jgi:hypothetical protein
MTFRCNVTLQNFAFILTKDTLLFVSVSESALADSGFAQKNRHEAQHIVFSSEVIPQLIDFLGKAADSN